MWKRCKNKPFTRKLVIVSNYIYKLHVMYIELILSSCLQGSSWPWWYGSWIHNYLCNRCLSPLMLWVQILLMVRCTTLCDQICQWLAAGQWFSPCPPVSSNNKPDRHDITEILLKVALNTIKPTNQPRCLCRVIFFSVYN